jgi:2-phospho-L-lactate guanylyltransferase
VTINVIVPAKPFREAKTRLAEVLSQSQRIELSRSLLQRTINVLLNVTIPIRPMVVSRDHEALALAEKAGFISVNENGHSNLNSALEFASLISQLDNSDSILILPADLPLITHVDVEGVIHESIAPPVVIIVPDRWKKGTNCLLINPADLIPFSFGTHSFIQHKHLAKAAGVRLKVIHNVRMEIDLDTSEDLNFILAHDTPNSSYLQVLEQFMTEKRGEYV